MWLYEQTGTANDAQFYVEVGISKTTFYRIKQNAENNIDSSYSLDAVKNWIRVAARSTAVLDEAWAETVLSILLEPEVVGVIIQAQNSKSPAKRGWQVLLGSLLPDSLKSK